MSQVPCELKHQKTATYCHLGREPFTRTPESTSSKGMFEAVVEDDDKLKQFRQSSSERATWTRPSDNASPTGSRERRPWTRRQTCLLQNSTGTVRERRRLPDASASQSIRTSLRREVPADQSARTRPLESRRHHSFGGTAAWKSKRTTKHDRCLTLALAKSGPRVAVRRHKPE